MGVCRRLRGQRELNPLNPHGAFIYLHNTVVKAYSGARFGAEEEMRDRWSRPIGDIPYLEYQRLDRIQKDQVPHGERLNRHLGDLQVPEPHAKRML